MKKALILFLVIFCTSFRVDVKTIKLELTTQEVQMLIDGLKRSREESWKMDELIGKILTQANDTAFQKR